ncbi:MAG: tautomerase family protein [Glaciihabitans sp.]|nr:tautomerase family protein [Glaciihabitans sp.]MCU1535635.1 tautomerase family protein [Glaciihabitans sp.]
MVPLIQVELDRKLYDEKGDEISREIHQAQIDALGTAPDDLFQIFHPHEPGELKFNPTYGGVDRRSLMVIRITLVHRHSVVTKKGLYKAILDRLAAIGVRADDVQIALVENGFEDWFAGKL